MSYYYNNKLHREVEEAKRKMQKERLKKICKISSLTFLWILAAAAVPASCYGTIKLANRLDKQEAVQKAIAEKIEGRTELHLAAISNDTESVDTLIVKGIDVNAKDGMGDTPLMLAARIGHTELCEALIAGGADVNMQNNEGLTALHQAAAEARIKTVESLIKNGADLTIKNNDGTTPLDFAIQNGNPQTALVLLDAEEEQGIKTVEKKKMVMENLIKGNERN